MPFPKFSSGISPAKPSPKRLYRPGRHAPQTCVAGPAAGNDRVQDAKDGRTSCALVSGRIGRISDYKRTLIAWTIARPLLDALMYFERPASECAALRDNHDMTTRLATASTVSIRVPSETRPRHRIPPKEYASSASPGVQVNAQSQSSGPPNQQLRIARETQSFERSISPLSRERAGSRKQARPWLTQRTPPLS